MSTTSILKVQNKMILGVVVSLLKEWGQGTRTSLKRYSGYPQEDTLRAIDYGLSNGVLTKVADGGYIGLKGIEISIFESDYYGCIKDMLNRHYTAMASGGRHLVAETAKKDTKTAGRWTRPDFTVVSSKVFPYIRQVEFDVITFEVKRPTDCEAIAVFEALAHNSAATKSYVFFPVTEADLSSNIQAERIKEECVRHGIGLFLVRNSYDLNEAYIAIESQRRPLNPGKCSQFLQSVLEANELSVLTTWPQ